MRASRRFRQRGAQLRPIVDALEARDGVVALTGVVSSFAKKSAAQQAAHRIAGLLDVAHDIEVRPDPLIARTDADIARGIRQVLEWDANLRGQSEACTG